MSRYNNTLIATAIRPDAKLGKLTVSRIGKYYAFTEDLDGFSSVEVKPQQLTPTERDFYCGNPYKRTQVLDETVTDIVLDVSASFPNLSTVIVGNTTQVVTGLDTMIGSLQGVTFVVPNSLQADYVVAYPNLTFTSWTFQIEFTIPYVGDSELTAEYVKLVVEHSSGDVAIVDKVIVPSEFTSFETGVFDYVFIKFPNCEEIEYGRQLPSAYQEVEYIESTGTQWIDSGVFTSNNVRVKLVAKNMFGFTTGERLYGGQLFGCRVSSSDSYFAVNTGAVADFVGNGSSYLTITKNTNTELIHIDYDNNSIEYICGNYSYINNNLNVTITTPKKIYIFAVNQNDDVPSQTSTIQIHSAEFYENGTLVRSFVPCYRKSDDEIGLYDTVNDVFYANQGTGVFLKGNDVIRSVERPALSTCHIYHDENTSHTLTSQIVQDTLTRFPEYASCEKVIVDEWFTEYESGSIDAIISAFSDMEELQLDATKTMKTDDFSLTFGSLSIPSLVLPNFSIITNGVSDTPTIDVGNIKQLEIKNLTVTNTNTRWGLFKGPNLEKLIVTGTTTHTVANVMCIATSGLSHVSEGRETRKLSYADFGTININGFRDNADGTAFVIGLPQGMTETTCLVKNLGSTALNKIYFSNNMTYDSLTYNLTNLHDYTGGTQHTLVLGSANLAKLTAEDLALATAKNWVVQ